jgi:hypothetical protein
MLREEASNAKQEDVLDSLDDHKAHGIRATARRFSDFATWEMPISVAPKGVMEAVMNMGALFLCREVIYTDTAIVRWRIPFYTTSTS